MTTEAKVLDLDHIEYDNEDGSHFEFIDLKPSEMEPVINHLLMGRPDSFFRTATWDALNRDITEHTHIIKDGQCYPYIYYMDSDGDAFNWQVTIRMIPEDLSE